MSRVIENIKKEFRAGSALTKLIYINVAVFLFFQFLYVFSFLFSIGELRSSSLFALPADVTTLAKKPWTIITYMFLHISFLHLLFNMLWLYFSGKIFLSFFSEKRLISTYVLGGICGGVLFILSFNLFPAFTSNVQNAIAIGASASVLSVVFAIATKSPNYNIRLFLIGNIKLKHIALACIILDILSIPKGNAGGHLAHLGGAFFGFLYVKQLNGGNDIASSFNKIMDYLAELIQNKPKLRKVYGKMKSDQEFREKKIKRQAQVDKILEKIAKSGYEGLTKEEKDILFQESKK